MIKRIITFPLLVVASFYIFIVEEFIWDPAVAFLKWTRKSLVILYVEDWIAKQKGWWAVAALLIIPGISIWPVKLAAIYLMGHGHIYSGIGLFITVKVVATALFAQLYTLIGQECEKVAWFHFVANKVRWVRDKVRAHSTYQKAHATLVDMKARIKSRKSSLKHRLLAVFKYLRMQKK